jgi:hypothetical protein
VQLPGFARVRPPTPTPPTPHPNATNQNATQKEIKLTKNSPKNIIPPKMAKKFPKNSKINLI